MPQHAREAQRGALVGRLAATVQRDAERLEGAGEGAGHDVVRLRHVEPGARAGAQRPRREGHGERPLEALAVQHRAAAGGPPHHVERQPGTGSYFWNLPSDSAGGAHV